MYHLQKVWISTKEYVGNIPKTTGNRHKIYNIKWHSQAENTKLKDLQLDLESYLEYLASEDYLEIRDINIEDQIPKYVLESQRISNFKCNDCGISKLSSNEINQMNNLKTLCLNGKNF